MKLSRSINSWFFFPAKRDQSNEFRTIKEKILFIGDLFISVRFCFTLESQGVAKYKHILIFVLICVGTKKIGKMEKMGKRLKIRRKSCNKNENFTINKTETASIGNIINPLAIQFLASNLQTEWKFTATANFSPNYFVSCNTRSRQFSSSI